VILFVLGWEFLRMISLSSSFFVKFTIKHAAGIMCVDEIE